MASTKHNTVDWSKYSLLPLLLEVLEALREGDATQSSRAVLALPPLHLMEGLI